MWGHGLKLPTRVAMVARRASVVPRLESRMWSSTSTRSIWHYEIHRGSPPWPTDRLEGKPTQVVETGDERTDIDEFSDAELTAILRQRIKVVPVESDDEPLN
jgi:hypothetical protein